MRLKQQDRSEWHFHRVWNCSLFSVKCIDGTIVWGETVERRWNPNLGYTTADDWYGGPGDPVGDWEYRIPEPAEYEVTESGRAIAAAYKKRQEGDK